MAAADKDAVRLTEWQAACLDRLRQGGATTTEIALAVKLNLQQTSNALKKLKDLGLAQRNEAYRWRATEHGEIASFQLAPRRKKRSGHAPGAGAQRLLDALERPKHVGELADHLRVTRQRVRQLAIDLYVRGLVKYGDTNDGIRIVARSDDPTELLSRAEERILSVLPAKRPVDRSQISIAARMPKKAVGEVLDALAAGNLVRREPGLDGEDLYAVTTAGTEHPQYKVDANRAEPPRLPVQSDRVFNVLTLIASEGPLRINQVSRRLAIPLRPMNALFQYLKRKSLVVKVGDTTLAPYGLTDRGRRVLSDWTSRRSEGTEGETGITGEA